MVTRWILNRRLNKMEKCLGVPIDAAWIIASLRIGRNDTEERLFIAGAVRDIRKFAGGRSKHEAP